MNEPLHVLVLESAAAQREEWLIAVDRCGHLGHPARSLTDARDRRGRLSPSVMLFSAELWAEGGPDLVRHFAEKGKLCRLILCGSEEVTASRAELIDQGIQAVLTLPLSSGELNHVIDAVMKGPPADMNAQQTARAAVRSEDLSDEQGEEESQAGQDEVRQHIQALAEQLGRGEVEISAISPVAVELQSLSLGSEPPSVTAMLEKIERDPNIASSVLRAANSVAYRGMPRVLDLNAAGRRLGSRRLGEIAQTAAVRGAFEEPTTSGWSELLNRMWRNTVTTAQACRILASEVGSVHPGQAYSMALFHNLGEVLVVDLHKERGEIAPPGGRAIGKLRRHMDKFHCELGEVLIRSWGLPGSLAALARHHHDPSKLPSGTPLGRSAWLVAACFNAVVEVGADYKDEHLGGPPLSASSAALGLSAERVLEVARRADAWWKGQGDEPVSEGDSAPAAPAPKPPPAEPAPETEAAAEVS